MKKIIPFVAALFIFSFTKINAQQISRYDIDLKINGLDLNNPFAGGLNAPQISEVDLNNDGVMDLHFFDKAGDVHVTFLNNGSTYSFAPEYAANFPELASWVLLRDFNADGIMDIFGYSNVPGVHGIVVFEGSYQDDAIVFEKLNLSKNIHGLLNFKQINSMGNVNYPNIAVTNEDLPAIDDIDGDGDMDVLTFDLGGSTVEYFRNTAVEDGHNLDSLNFELEDQCWGKFKEGGLDAEIFLSSNPTECANLWDPTGNGTVDTRHAGSTLLTLDLNNDGAKELILGDLTGTKLVQLNNGGTPTEAFMDGIDDNFPAYDVPVDMPIFLAAFYLDVDNDGNKDLLVAPNNDKSSEDDQNIWFYKNTNNNETPLFAFQQNDFLVNEMLDLGTGANPTFVDYNADGLLDIVVGNISFYLLFGEKESRLFLFENIGTADLPKYELVDDDYLSMQQYNSATNYFNYSPTFGDLDNDGDLDLIVGEETGRLIYFENIAGPGNPLEFAAPDLFYKGIDAGQGVNPQIVDVNRDGLADLLIGWRLGRIIYFPNIGSTGSPDFEPDAFAAPNDAAFGNVDTRIAQGFDGSVSPQLIDVDGEYVLYCGTQRGRIEVYENIDGNLDGDFTLVDSILGNIREGQITHPALADLNDDGKFEILIGNSRGGLGFFTEGAPVSTKNIRNSLAFNAFPNPSEDFIYLKIEGLKNEKAWLQIYNTIGQSVLSKELNYSKNGVDIRHLTPGIYFCEIIVGEKRGIQKIVKR